MNLEAMFVPGVITVMSVFLLTLSAVTLYARGGK